MKKLRDLINEGKEIYKVYFSDGNTIKITSDKGEDGAREFVKKIQGGRAGALSGAMHWTKNLKIKKIVKESVNEKISKEEWAQHPKHAFSEFYQRFKK